MPGCRAHAFRVPRDIGAIHAERGEQPLAQQRLQVAAGATRHRIGQQHRGEVGVLGRASRRGGQAHVAERGEQLLLVQPRIGIGRVHTGGGEPRRQRRQSAGVVDQVAQQDRLAVELRHHRARRQVVGQRVVERGAALADQVGQQGRRHRLADRADLEGAVRIDAALGVPIGAAEAACDLIAPDHCHGEAGAGAVAGKALVDQGAQLRIVDGLGGRGGRDGQGQAEGERSCGHGGHPALGGLPASPRWLLRAGPCDERPPAGDEAAFAPISPAGARAAQRHSARRSPRGPGARHRPPGAGRRRAPRAPAGGYR